MVIVENGRHIIIHENEEDDLENAKMGGIDRDNSFDLNSSDFNSDDTATIKSRRRKQFNIPRNGQLPPLDLNSAHKTI